MEKSKKNESYKAIRTGRFLVMIGIFLIVLGGAVSAIVGVWGIGNESLPKSIFVTTAAIGVVIWVLGVMIRRHGENIHKPYCYDDDMIDFND